jgi:quinol monooxygenase YgiN
MTDYQQWIVEFSINRGKLEEFERLAKNMADAVRRSEPGTQQYEWFINRKENKCLVIESYDSSVSGSAHVNGEAIRRFFPQLLKVSKVSSFRVCGDPSPELIKELDDVNAKVYQFVGGYSR